VAVNERTSLNQLYGLMRELLLERFPELENHQPTYVDFRRGDVRHSQADITKAAKLLGFEPSHRIDEGLKQAMSWYIAHFTPAQEGPGV
jgi:UDP-N-acetylglucosamine 4-epimerase